MKKTVACLIVILLLLSGCACSNEETSMPTLNQSNQTKINDTDSSQENASVSTENDLDSNEGSTPASKDEPVKSEAESDKTKEQPTSSEKTESIDSHPLTPSLKTERTLPQFGDRFEDFDAIKEAINLEDHIIFRGKKIGEEQSYEIGEYTYFPIQLKVIEPLYGNVKREETIVLHEKVKFEINDDVILGALECDRVKDNTDYIFILEKKTDAAKGGVYYVNTSGDHSLSSFADKAMLAEKVKMGTATQIQRFRYSVLTAYESKDLRLDLQAEAAKLMGNLSEDASSEEILNALPEKQRDLFRKMIAQYGTK